MLWHVGSQLVETRVDGVDSALDGVIQLVAETLEAGSAGRWHSDLTLGTSILHESWDADEASFRMRDLGVRIADPAVADQLVEGGGVARFPVRQFLDPTDIPSVWEDAEVLLVVIEFDGGQADTLALLGRSSGWDDAAAQFCRAVATVLRQTLARVEVERNLQARLELGRFVAATQRRLGAADNDTASTVLEEVVCSLTDRLDVDSIGVFEWGERMGCLHQAGRPFAEAWLRLFGKQRRLGVHTNVGEITLLRQVDAATALLGDRAGDVEVPDRQVAIVPLSTGDGPRRSFVAVKDGLYWSEVDQEAIAAVARSTAEMLARVDAERWSGFHLRVQEEFAATVAAFLRGKADDFDDLVSDALGRVARSIGAPIAAVIDSQEPAARSCGRVVALWNESGSAFEVGGSVRFPQGWVNEAVAAGETVITSFTMDDRLLVDGPREGGRVPTWTLVCTPVANWPSGRAAVGLLLQGDQTHRGSLVVEMLGALGDLLTQLCVRLDLEKEARWREGVQGYINDMAATFAEAGEHEFDEVLKLALARGAEFLQLNDISLWSVDPVTGRVVLRSAANRSGGRTRKRDPLASMVSDVGRTGDPVLTGDCVVLPRRALDQTTVIAARRRESPIADRDVRTLQNVLDIVSRTQRRVTAERNAQTAFGQSPIGVLLCDDELEIITCNPAFARFLGYDSPSLVASLTADEVLHTTVSKPSEGTFELPFKRLDGGKVWGVTHTTPIESATTGDRMWLVHVEDATERRRAEQLLRHQASTDELTGLANRWVLTNRIEAAMELGEVPIVLLLDLDRFKNVNDSLGHDRGDELLVAVADRLRLGVRPGDVVVRLGGDEFAVLLEQPTDEADARVVAERLLGLLDEPVLLAGQSIFPSASIGIAQATLPTSVSELLRAADTAMYHAKALGGARHATFDRAMEGQASEHLQIEAGLRHALRNGELSVHYQPEFSMSDGRFLGAEALVRWEHPLRGLVPARSFVSVAEETGMIAEIGSFVLREACRQAASWRDLESTIRVNFSAGQLQRADTVHLIRETLEEVGLPAERLCVEITESAVMEDIERAEDVLHDLKRLGVGVALDDFGTGFSSLAYLRRFPVDTVKIDLSFVGNLDGVDRDDAIVRSILSLAEALEMEVVAEGVETRAQVDALLRLGCDRAQGYFYARPMPVQELADHVALAF